ncbi:hypothetical protein ACQUQU_04070 [Thalassolituus sp. LLYu03]|uniref:DUF7793 family protein n=1 Tax=Thalassolituus sp. LLYu03 TaxID=3421656 RepID=UPI003D2AD58E
MTIRGVDSSAKPITWLGSNGIVYHDLAGFSHLTLALVSYIHRAHIRVGGREPRPVLLLGQDILTIDFEVQIFASHPDVLHAVGALGIVGNSFMLRHLTSMFLSYHQPAYPVQRFDLREEAEAWLLGAPGLSQADQ